MAKNIQPTIETGAMTLVLLVKNYRSQMIALLLKNGVTVPNGASDQQIALLMANLLKVSKSFFADLNNFLKSPKVLETLAGGLTENAQYFRVTGTDATTTTGTTPAKTGFFSNLNFGNLFSQALGAFGQYDTNQANVAIANAHANVNTPTGGGTTTGDSTGGNTGGGKTPDEGLSTTTIVVLSLVGVAVLGTIIYFVARPKQ